MDSWHRFYFIRAQVSFYRAHSQRRLAYYMRKKINVSVQKDARTANSDKPSASPVQFLHFRMSYKHDKTWVHPHSASPLASHPVKEFIIGAENKNHDQNITPIRNSNVNVRKKNLFQNRGWTMKDTFPFPKMLQW